MGEAKQNWPAVGPEFNRWNGDLKGFAELLDSARGEYWWTRDFQLKYLRINVDTRDGSFMLSNRDGEIISPDRVVAAINENRERRSRRA